MPSEMDSWARPVQSAADFPDIFREALQAVLSAEEPFRRMIFAPADKWGLRKKTDPKLVFIHRDSFYFLEKVKKEIRSACFPLDNLLFIQYGTILLYSWLKISGLIDGRVVTRMIEFNSVMRDLFKDLVTEVRHSIVESDQVVCRSERKTDPDELKKFDGLGASDYKFMNYAKMSLLPGEQVIHFIHQPLYRRKRYRFFSYTAIFPHLHILTDKELIIINDEARKDQARYGGIWTYIPLRKVVDLRLVNDSERGVFQLQILLPHDQRITNFFALEQHAALHHAFLNNFNNYHYFGKGLC